MATYSVQEYIQWRIGAGLSLGVLLRFLGIKLFSQLFPRPFFHVFHLLQNVCKRRKERAGERGRKAEKQRNEKPSCNSSALHIFSFAFILMNFYFRA